MRRKKRNRNFSTEDRFWGPYIKQRWVFENFPIQTTLEFTYYNLRIFKYKNGYIRTNEHQLNFLE